jgi:hypothetical protein
MGIVQAATLSSCSRCRDGDEEDVNELVRAMSLRQATATPAVEARTWR